ncbi:MAG: hypothetical protein WCF33_12435 [Pseudonocardiaceae bacterium]
MLKRASTIVGCAVVGMLASAVPAFADNYGSVECGESPTPACELGVGKGGNGPGHYGGNPDRRSPRGEQGDHSGGADGGDHIVGGTHKWSTHCSYVRSDYQPPTNGVTIVAYQPRGGSGAITVQPAVFWRPVVGRAVLAAATAAPAPGQPGAWYVYLCDGTGIIPAVYHPPVWIPDGKPGGAPSAAELARQARSQLVLPSPRIEANPAGAQLVNLPTWLWLDPAAWGPRSATAQVPGVSVTAVARPTSVSWSLGDGTSVTCPGQGTPFLPGGDPRAVSPDCGHTYRSSSAGQASQAFPVTATVHWVITWSGAGQSGTFPDVTTTATARLRVAEAQALGNGTG